MRAKGANPSGVFICWFRMKWPTPKIKTAFFCLRTISRPITSAPKSTRLRRKDINSSRDCTLSQSIGGSAAITRILRLAGRLWLTDRTSFRNYS